jgi:hypothetical protein
MVLAPVDRLILDRQSSPAMTATPRPDPQDSEFWRNYLTNGSPFERQARRLFMRIPREQEITKVVSLHVGPAPR